VLLRSYFREMKERGEIPRGQDLAACLAVSGEAITSLLSPAVPSQASDTEPNSPRSWPFVLAVDVEYDAGNFEDKYGGSLRVAIETLLTDLFPLLARQILAPEELAATLDSEDEVWIGV
jgi:hypothetical protein